MDGVAGAHPHSRAPRRRNRAPALRDEILFRTYLQWIAGEQWNTARTRANGVALFGDLPFMVNGDSADVWSRQDEFGQDGSVGVPPDAFSATGQDWGLPPYLWDVLEDRDFDWLRLRAKRMAQLFDGYRVDHLVGFYRTYVRPRGGGAGVFTPADEPSQIALGEQRAECLSDRPVSRSSPKTSAPCPTSFVRRSRVQVFPAIRSFAGSAIGTSLDNRSGTRSSIQPLRLRHRVRTTPSR